MNTRRLTLALRAGVSAYAALVLLSALLASPFGANHQDFGHSHPSHTAAHVHSLQSFLGGTAAVPAAPLRLALALVSVLPLLSSQTLKIQLARRYFASRAPPTTV